LPDRCWIHSKADEGRREPVPRVNGAVPCADTAGDVSDWRALTGVFEVGPMSTREYSSNGGIIIMVALCNRADHYIFMLWFVLSFFFFFFFFLA